MKKPSTRIREIFESDKEHVGDAKRDFAIIQYLDEIYEKNKPCEHKSSYQVDSTGDVYYNVCNDCGVLFLAKKDLLPSSIKNNG